MALSRLPLRRLHCHYYHSNVAAMDTLRRGTASAANSAIQTIANNSAALGGDGNAERAMHTVAASHIAIDNACQSVSSMSSAIWQRASKLVSPEKSMHISTAAASSAVMLPATGLSTLSQAEAATAVMSQQSTITTTKQVQRTVTTKAYNKAVDREETSDHIHRYDPPNDPEFEKFIEQEADRLGEPLPKLQHPVVLVHGFIGHDYVMKNPFTDKPMFEYFGSVRSELEEAGIYVLAPQLPRLASTSTRAKALATALGLREVTQSDHRTSDSQHVKDTPGAGKREDRKRKQTASRTMRPTGPVKDQSCDDNKPNSNKRHAGNDIEMSDMSASARADKQGAANAAAKSSVQPSTGDNGGDEDLAEVTVLGGDDVDLSKYKGKFNIIAHSMGGIDSRHVAAHFGCADRIASITTIGSPHHGSPIADITLQTITNDPITAIHLAWRNLRDPSDISPDGMVNLFEASEHATVYQTSIRRLLDALGIDTTGLRTLATDAMRVFNLQTPDQPSIAYMSIGAHKQVPIINPQWFTQRVVTAREGCNDGLVSVKSAAWGHYLYTSELDHIEQIGLGVTNAHLPLFRALVRYLHHKGF